MAKPKYVIHKGGLEQKGRRYNFLGHWTKGRRYKVQEYQDTGFLCRELVEHSDGYEGVKDVEEDRILTLRDDSGCYHNFVMNECLKTFFDYIF